MPVEASNLFEQVANDGQIFRKAYHEHLKAA